MAKRRQSLADKAGEFELNLTPMIDAVFLLLIFFMTTTVFVNRWRRPPESSKA